MAQFNEVPVIDLDKTNCNDLWNSLAESISSAKFIAIDFELSGLGNRKLLSSRDIGLRYDSIRETVQSRSIVAVGVSCFRRIDVSSSNSSAPSTNNCTTNEDGETVSVNTICDDDPKNKFQEHKHSDVEGTGVIQDTTDKELQLINPELSELGGNSLSANGKRSHDQIEDSLNCSTKKKCTSTHSIKKNNVTYLAQTFNLIILCQKDYVVEPDSLTFLVNHGFDFNRQYEHGIPYLPGIKSDNKFMYLKRLFAVLVQARVPLVFHNGLIDLMFLYQHFYGDLPAKLESFTADVSDLFPSGIFDTKYLVEYNIRIPASYLQYVFRKCQRENKNWGDKGGGVVILNFIKYPKDFPYVTRLDTALRETRKEDCIKVCRTYASYGWCRRGVHCDESHNIDDILDVDENLVKKTRKKTKKFDKPETISEGPKASQGKVAGKGNGHRAGFDAMMTGYIFAFHHQKLRTGDTADDLCVDDLKNKVYLSGINHPLLIVKSEFAKNSSFHTENFHELSEIANLSDKCISS